MKALQKLNLSQLFATQSRGALLDTIVFLINLLLMWIITGLSLNLVRQAAEDRLAKLAIGLFFGGLLLLQPLGPILKRWSFHQRHKSFNLSKIDYAGCLLFWHMFFYIVMMMLISAAASMLLSESIFENDSARLAIGVMGFLGGFVFSIIGAVLIFRYFLTPRKPPRWKFLMSPQSAALGDTCMFLNVICLQIVWNSLIASAFFREEMLTGNPLGKPGSFTDILGRFILIGLLALLVYIPARIFYLVEDQRLKRTWVTMLLANLPLIVRAFFASHHG